ncbi:hypothetical protein BGX31_007848 [Mortierella sp. GBA43]|nr:hypothetical protein BGX31_007848 [Mortierella sp. GBA43]
MNDKTTFSDEESKPTINIAPFVRYLHVEEDHPVIEIPFSYTQFGVVLMVDIVGFSRMASIASSKGDVGAEILSSQIGDYFDRAIKIIEYHGDALLVVFQADPFAERQREPHTDSQFPYQQDGSQHSTEDTTASLRRNKLTVRRAIECSLELLVRLSHYRIYLSEREYARKLSGSSNLSDDGSSNEDGTSSYLSSGNDGVHPGINGTQGHEPPRNGLNLLGNVHGSVNSHRGIAASRRLAHSMTDLRSGPGSIEHIFKRSSSSDSGGDIRQVDQHSAHRQSTYPHTHSGNHNTRPLESHSRFLSGTGPGPGGMPLLLVPPLVVQPAETDAASRPNSVPPVVRGGATGSRKRQGSGSSASLGPGPISSKTRGGFFATAKHLFSHSSGGEKYDRSQTGYPMSEPMETSDDSYDLQLHMAMSAGDVSNIIIGDLGGDSSIDNLLERNTGRLEYAICGEQMSTIEDALNLARAGEVTITKSAWQYVNPDAYPSCEPRRNCFILKASQAKSEIDLPLMRRVRNDKLLNTPVESNPHYFKYINKSAIHRLMLYPNGEYPAQFRNATILFVSLGDVKPWTADGLALCQEAMVIVHNVTSMYEGFIQQFAVDDKGATILCAFGLPYPRSHEKEASFAAKTAWLIRQRFLDAHIRGFRISLATGVIFTSTIGNEFRRDPAIVGDTIVIAVRILGFGYAKESIVCDDATMIACTSDSEGLCEFEDMGEEYVKGKSHPLRIWRLLHFGTKRQTHHYDILVDETIGYQPERAKVSKFISAWSQAPDRNTLMVTGPRGSGKCMFYQQISHIARNSGFNICSATSVEVEQNTEYYLIKFLLLGLFEVMLKHEIPYHHPDLQEETVPFTTRVDSKDIVKDTSVDTTYTTFSVDTAMSQATVPSIERVHSSSIESTCGRFANSPRGSAMKLTLSQYEDPFETGIMSKSKLQGLIGICLDKMGKNGGNLSMPVLNNIITAISSDNMMPSISHSDDEILVEFIVRILNYASQYVKIIVVLEELQWCDCKTLHVIHAIHEHCPSVLVVLFTRSRRDYGGKDIVKTITNHSKNLEIALDGLKPREIEQVLLQAFRPKGVDRISPEILELVQERTKGNPLFVKHMSLLLQEFCHVNIVDGELVKTSKETSPSSASKPLEELLLRQDRKKIVLMQYDRLRPKFQEFLKIASCLGEKFPLAEITAIKPLKSLLGVPDKGKSYTTLIWDLDTYRFLSLATDQQSNLQLSSNVELQTVYMFGSSSTAADIYDSIPYEERVGYHLKMAQYYESFLEQHGYDEDCMEQPLTCQDIIPQITYHYMKTDCTEKKIKYLKTLAAFHLKGNMLTDATLNIDELINILDTDRGAKAMVSDEDLADIYGMKGECLSKRMHIEEAEAALLDSLARYRVSWPSGKHQWKRELMKEGIKFKYYFRTGQIPVEQKPGKEERKSKVNAKTQVRLTRIIRVLYCLQNIYFWKTEPEAAMLSSLYTLRYTRKLGHPSGYQAASLGRIALLSYYHGNKQECQKYISAALRVRESGESTGGMLSAVLAYVEYGEGRHTIAHQLLDQAINESKTFGVVTHLMTFYRAVTMKTAYRMLEGAFNVHPEDSHLLRTLSAIAIQNGDSEGETLFAVPTLANLLIQDRLRDAESWVVLVERFIMPKSRLMNLLIVQGILSFYYAKAGDHENVRIYIRKLGQDIQRQCVSPHPFPLMSCMFALMAIYEVYNSQMDKEYSGFDPEPLFSINTDADLVHFVTYLKMDPLRHLAEPFICLAEAMRHFLVQGHESEGAQKLEQGFRELSPALEDITFVKAYFLAQIARHSSSESKNEHYKEAYRLFRSMSMDPLIWLTDSKISWSLQPFEKAGFVCTLDDIPQPIHAGRLEGGLLDWAASEVPKNRSSVSVAAFEGIPAVVDQHPHQDPTTTATLFNWVISDDVDMDEASFNSELARASISAESRCA